MEAYDDEKVKHPPKFRLKNMEQASIHDSKEKIERKLKSPATAPLATVSEQALLQDPNSEIRRPSIATLGIHPMSPNCSERERGQKLTTESLKIFNNQAGQSPLKSLDWAAAAAANGVDALQLAKSEPAGPGMSPVLFNIDSYIKAAEEYRVHKFFKPGNIKYSPRSNATPKTPNSTGVVASDGFSVKAVSKGIHHAHFDVKAPVRIRDKGGNSRRRSVFSVLSEDKADMSQCNREFLLRHIGSLENELRQERQFRRLTEGMLYQREAVEGSDARLQNAVDWIWPTKEYRTAGEHSDALRKRLKHLAQVRGMEKSKTPKHDSQPQNEESIDRDSETNNDTQRKSIELTNNEQKDRPQLPKVPDFRDTASENQIRPSNERKLNIELSMSAKTINHLHNLIAGHEPSNPNPPAQSHIYDCSNKPEVAQEPSAVAKGKHTFKQSSYPPVLKEFFYLTAISVKLKLAKKYKTDPSVGTPTDELWKEVQREKLAFTDFHDFLIASEEQKFRDMSQGKNGTSSSFLGFFYFFGGS